MADPEVFSGSAVAEQANPPGTMNRYLYLERRLKKGKPHPGESAPCYIDLTLPCILFSFG